MNPISPIDGRYYNNVKELSLFFSEKAIVENRFKVELEYLKYILKVLKINKKVPDISFSFESIKKIETQGIKNIPATNHDGKAIEYFIKLHLDESIKEFVHFGLTTEDVTNIAIGVLLKESLSTIILPKLNQLLMKLKKFSLDDTLILARTHGQIASITTFGHQFFIFYKRLEKEINILKKQKIYAKLNGSVGTFSALNFAYSNIDWIKFSQSFIKSLNLEAELYTTQILSGENYSRIFHNLLRINLILLDFCQDVWRYISEKWLIQKIKKGEIGSSVMPHKVNPIDFENAEGNLKTANMLLDGIARELPVSRLQRDLSDSTVKRNFGVPLAHSLLAYKKILQGLEKISVNKEFLSKLIEKHPEVLTEAYQTELRKHIKKPYELLKEISRGKEITLNDLHNFVASLNISQDIKEKLLKLKPKEYTGLINSLINSK